MLCEVVANSIFGNGVIVTIDIEKQNDTLANHQHFASWASHGVQHLREEHCTWNEQNEINIEGFSILTNK